MKTVDKTGNETCFRKQTGKISQGNNTGKTLGIFRDTHTHAHTTCIQTGFWRGCCEPLHTCRKKGKKIKWIIVIIEVLVCDKLTNYYIVLICQMFYLGVRTSVCVCVCVCVRACARVCVCARARVIQRCNSFRTTDSYIATIHGIVAIL